MKAVRLAALGAAIVLGVSTVATAQPPARTQRAAAAARPGKRIARTLFRDLNLSTAQRDQLRVIQKKYAEQRKTLVTQLRAQRGSASAKPDSATRARMHNEVRALMEKQVAEMRAVLTPDQQRKFDANYASVRDRAKAHGGKRAKRGA